MIEQILLAEAFHHDEPIDRFSLAADLEAVAGTGHRLDGEIDLGRRPAVQLQLALASLVAQGDGREIEEVELHGFLQFVRPLAGEEDMGNMGVDPLDRRAAMSLRIGEKAKDGVLIRCRAIVHGKSSKILLLCRSVHPS